MTKLAIDTTAKSRRQVQEAIDGLVRLHADGEVIGVAIMVVAPNGETHLHRSGGGSDRELLGAMFLQMFQIASHGWTEGPST